ncbi:hypothetical protein [Nitrosopumilus sp.]|uniref:hypothetical protein n=1 Tax=Nitrosopumilus sp. TaxID=2024843 RepID=UPI003D0C1576
MKIWMLQSKKKFVVGILMLTIAVLIITSAIGNMIGNNSEDSAKKEHQTLDEFKSKYMTEQDTGNNDQNYFVDTTGYTPEWAKDIGPEQTEAKCTNIMLDLDSLYSNEYNWCNEFIGYQLDKLN